VEINHMPAFTLIDLLQLGRDYGLGALVLVLVLAIIWTLGKDLIAKGFSIHVDVGRKGQRF
jgi:hypothetical protein